MKFGENLKQIRKSKNISQEDLAERLGVSRQSVSKWETGENYPSMYNIMCLCDIFKCKINNLVHESMPEFNSLDKEIKMSVVKFKENEQKKMKGFTKVLVNDVPAFPVSETVRSQFTAMCDNSVPGLNTVQSTTNSVVSKAPPSVFAVVCSRRLLPNLLQLNLPIPFAPDFGLPYIAEVLFSTLLVVAMRIQYFLTCSNVMPTPLSTILVSTPPST